jgi:large subunit ribosomal protein L11
MAKIIKTILKLQLEAGKANPAPPVGTALGPHGVNIQDFCKKFNDATKDMAGDVVPAEITVYEDRTFDFKLKTPPASALLKKAARPIGEARSDGAAGIEKGSADSLKVKVGKVTKADLRAIAERKMVDLNAYDVDAAVRIIEGTARNMGIEVID